MQKKKKWRWRVVNGHVRDRGWGGGGKGIRAFRGFVDEDTLDDETEHGPTLRSCATSHHGRCSLCRAGRNVLLLRRRG